MLDSLRGLFPQTEIANHGELSLLMKALGFKWGHLHSSYYIRLSKRVDVQAHRFEVVPMLQTFMTSPDFVYFNMDWSFEHENATSKSGWISMAVEGSDLVDSKPGKGRRISFCEFVTKNGVLRHPDGKSAGSILQSNETLAGPDVLRTMKRGFEAIVAHPDVQAGGKAVVHLDGARNQTVKEDDYINPDKMNLMDGGKNRVAMDGIDMKGLRTVLSEHNQWSDSMTLADAKEKLWASKMVRDQLSQVERLAEEFGIIVVYNPKAHPWLCFIEKLWRWIKFKLQNLLSLTQIRARYEELIEDFMIGSAFARAKCNKWFELSKKYLEYYSRGGLDIVRECDMKKLDLTTMPRARPKAKFNTLDKAAQSVHAANFILFRGKHYIPSTAYW
jgi:hypothetical protein